MLASKMKVAFRLTGCCQIPSLIAWLQKGESAACPLILVPTHRGVVIRVVSNFGVKPSNLVDHAGSPLVSTHSAESARISAPTIAPKKYSRAVTDIRTASDCWTFQAVRSQNAFGA